MVHGRASIGSYSSQLSVRREALLTMGWNSKKLQGEESNGRFMIHAVIITGASKGFGRAVAKAVARGLEYDVHFVLSGRDQTELDEARSELFEMRQNQKRAVTCDIIVGDLSNLVQLEKIADSLFGPTCLYKDASNIQSITFFNNAGSLGTLCPVGSSSNNVVDMSAAVNLNVTACTYLTSEFVRRYEAQHFPQSIPPRATVVNVSSLAAQQPFPSWSVYCAGKAARDMYHSVLASEQRIKWQDVDPTKGSREVRVLNYAPGPLDTNMQATIRDAEQKDTNLGRVYTDMKEQNLLVDPLVSAEKLLLLLNTPHSFKSGDHVDYYDDIQVTTIEGSV